MKRYAITVTIGKGTAQEKINTSFDFPADPVEFKGWVASLDGDALTTVFKRALSGTDLAARAGVRPASEVKTTIIKAKAGDVDLYTLAPEVFCKRYNLRLALEQEEGKAVPGAYKHTLTLLVADGKIKVNSESGLAKASK